VPPLRTRADRRFDLIGDLRDLPAGSAPHEVALPAALGGTHGNSHS
jgi:hypothetical protein